MPHSKPLLEFSDILGTMQIDIKTHIETLHWTGWRNSINNQSKIFYKNGVWLKGKLVEGLYG